MRRIIILFLCVLLCKNLNARFFNYKGWQSHDIEVMGGIGNVNGHKNGYIDLSYTVLADKYSPFISASYIFKFNDYLGLGCSATHEQLNIVPDFEGGLRPINTYMVFGANASIKGYIPTSNKNIKLIGVFEAGNAAIMHKDTFFFPNNDKDFPDNSFVYSPQFGIRFILSDKSKFALNARGFYKEYTRYKCNVWGILLGVSF